VRAPDALQKYIEDPLSEAIIPGTLPRPAEFDVYLSDTGIFCRQIVEQPVGAGGIAEEVPQPPGTLCICFKRDLGRHHAQSGYTRPTTLMRFASQSVVPNAVP